MLTRYWFSIAAILLPTQRAEERILDEIGRRTVRYVRESIRISPSPSTPGQPPTSRSGAYPRSIFHRVDQQSRKVIVTAERFANRYGTSVPDLLEFGGTVVRWRREAGRVQRIAQRFRARPHFAPAAEKAAQEFPGLWKDAIR